MDCLTATLIKTHDNISTMVDLPDEDLAVMIEISSVRVVMIEIVEQFNSSMSRVFIIPILIEDSRLTDVEEL